MASRNLPPQIVSPEQANFLRLWQLGISIPSIAKRLGWHKSRVSEYANYLRSEGIELWGPFEVDWRLDLFPEDMPEG